MNIIHLASRAAGPLQAALPAVALGLSAIFLFYNAVRYTWPIGYAGLYAQASEQIAQNHFRLPADLSFYGPGKLPFAYPPLAFYVMAFFTDLGVSPLTYMRFVPALLSFLALIPLYFLAATVAQSQVAAVAAVVICAASPTLYAAHTWASGIVRAQAFLLFLCGAYLFDRAIHAGAGRPLLAVLAGVLFGLVFLTHLLYAWFIALWVAGWVIANPKAVGLKAGVRCLSVAVLVGLPWVLVMVSRYGLQPFSYALHSHGNTAFLDVLTQRQDMLTWVASKLAGVTSIPFLIVFAALGLAYCVARRQYGLPFVMLASLLVLSPEGGRFLVFLAALVAAASHGILSHWLAPIRWAQVLGSILAAILVVNAAVLGFLDMHKIRPQLRDGALELGGYFKKNTPAQSRYLFVAPPNEAEWFPYLLQRQPLASKWGAEWLGTEPEQSALISSINSCRQSGSVACLRELDLQIDSADMLVTLRADKKLSVDLEAWPDCPQVALIGQYILWRAGCLTGVPS